MLQLNFFAKPFYLESPSHGLLRRCHFNRARQFCRDHICIVQYCFFSTSSCYSPFLILGVPCQQSKPEKLHGGGVPGAFAFDEKKHLGLKVHSQKPKSAQKKAKPDFKK